MKNKKNVGHVEYMNLIDGVEVAKRVEDSNRIARLRADLINARNAVMPTKFSLVGTEIDAVLGRIVVVEVTK